MATEETMDHPTPLRPASTMNLGSGGRPAGASGSRVPGGRRVVSMAADDRPPPRRGSTAADEMPPPRRRSTATEEMPRGRPQSIRIGGGSGHGRSPPPRSSSGRSPARPSSGRSPPPRSSSGRGGGGGRGHSSGMPQQREFDSIHHMPAGLQNKYGAQLGRFASSGGRSAGGRGGRSVFSGRVTADGRKVPIAPPVKKNKIVLPTQGTPYTAPVAVARPPMAPTPMMGPGPSMGPGRGGTRHSQSERVVNVAPAPMGRKKKRDSGNGPPSGMGVPDRVSPATRSPAFVPRPVSPLAEPDYIPKKKVSPKIRKDPFMFPIDDDVIRDIAQPGGSVRILICSANLGNAQPDELSLNEWVPANGSMSHVLTNPRRYPVMLNFPSEIKEDVNITSTDRAVYASVRTRSEQLLTISEHTNDWDLSDDSEIFASPMNQAFINLPSSQITIETVDEEADEDDQSVIEEDTLEVTRILSLERAETGTTEGHVEESETTEFAEEAEPEAAEPAGPSEVVEETEPVEPSETEVPETAELTEVTEESETAEQENVAVPDATESNPVADPIEEEPKETEAEAAEDTFDEGKVDSLMNSEQSGSSANGSDLDVPRRYTASSKKLDSIRKRIEDSIKKSQADGFAFGDAFHARQKSMLEAEKLRSQEARERMHLGSMAPDKATNFEESFAAKQTATEKEEREKRKSTKDKLKLGSIGLFGRKKKPADQGSNSLPPPQTPQRNNVYLQAVPAAISLSPKSASQSEENEDSKGDHPVESSAQNSSTKGDENDARSAEGTEDLDQTTAAADVVINSDSNTAVDDVVNPDEIDANPEVKSSHAVAQSQEKESDNVDEQPKNPARGDGNDDDEADVSNSAGNSAFDAVGKHDESENDGGYFVADNNDGDIQGDSRDDFENHDEFVEPEPYYEEGPQGHFEIIVIGMQEATFDPNKDADAKDSEFSGSERSSRTASGSDSEGSDDDDDDDYEGSDYDDENDDEEDDEADDSDDEGLTASGSSDEDYDIDDAPNSSKSMNGSGKDDKSPKASKRLLHIAKKAGKGAKNATKGAMKVGKGALGKGKKKLKAAQKTSKAVKTLMSAKNHTKREVPSMRQETSPSEDGAMANWEDTDILHFQFDEQLPSYERALSYQLGEMRLMVYYLKTSVELDVLSVKAKPTGKANLANKGGIVTEVAVNKATRLCFSSAHLEAHEGEKKFEKRCKSFERIFKAANSSVTAFNFDTTMASHYSFFMGDLNFRTKLPHCEPGSDEHIQASHDLTARKNWGVLNRHDELSNALLDNKCLAGWKTPYCNFDPTFKVARKDGYQYNVLRSPSYTDRILYKAIDQLEDSLEVSLYEPITHFTSSDHKPIRGAFEIQLNEKLDLKPRIPTLKKEKLHILFTSIEIILYSDKYKPKSKSDEVVKPNPFVSFISTPRDALELDSSSRKRSGWKRLGLKKSTGRTAPGRSKSDVGNSKFNPLSARWPGTSVIEGTFTPQWKNDEIHFELGTKNKSNNRQLDLSGALMHVAVFDQRESNPKPLGSFTLNLASLIKVTKESDKNKGGNSRDAGSTGRKARAMKKDSPSEKSFRHKLSKQPSTRLTGLIESLADELEMDSQESKRLNELKITTLKFDEALVESGVQTGEIKCTVDAWWMDEEEEE